MSSHAGLLMPDPSATWFQQFSPEQLAAMAQAGETGVIEALWRRFQPLVRRLLYKYESLGIAEDLVGNAYIALHQLTLAYDTARGVPFTAYLERMLFFALRVIARRQWRLDRREVTDSQQVESHM